MKFCRKCQGLIEQGQPFCSRCFTPVQRPSIMRRVFGRFIEWCGGRMGVAGVKGDEGSALRSSTSITLRTSEKITVHDENTGQMRQYTNMKDLPPELRAKVEAALDQHGAIDENAIVTEQSMTKRITTGPDGLTSREITVRDADGIQRRYGSVDELPPELRRKFDALRKDNG